MAGFLCCALQEIQSEYLALLADLRPIEVGPHYACPHLTMTARQAASFLSIETSSIQTGAEAAAVAAAAGAVLGILLGGEAIIPLAAAFGEVGGFIGSIVGFFQGLFSGGKYTRFALGPNNALYFTDGGVFPEYLAHCYGPGGSGSDVPVWLGGQQGIPTLVYAPPGSVAAQLADLLA